MYLVYLPTFSLNSSATTITAAYKIGSSVSSHNPAPPSPLPTYTGSLAMATQGTVSYGQLYTLQAEWYGGGWLNSQAFLQVGYAVTANDSQGAVAPTQGQVVAVGPALPMSNSDTSSTIPAISLPELTASFSLPDRPSTFWNAFRVFGGVQEQFTSASTWYGHTGATAASGYDYDVDPIATWYAPAVTLTASPVAAKQNAAATLTIQVPSWVRTITASDFTATGGTLTNFTKVS